MGGGIERVDIDVMGIEAIEVHELIVDAVELTLGTTAGGRGLDVARGVVVTGT